MQVVSMMGRLTASADIRLSTRLTLSVENVNTSDSRPYENARENESGRMKWVGSGSDCEKLVHKDGSLTGIQPRGGEGYASVNVNESRSVHLNVSESAISGLGNENVNGQSVNDYDHGDRGRRRG